MTVALPLAGGFAGGGDGLRGGTGRTPKTCDRISLSGSRHEGGSPLEAGDRQVSAAGRVSRVPRVLRSGGLFGAAARRFTEGRCVDAAVVPIERRLPPARVAGAAVGMLERRFFLPRAAGDAFIGAPLGNPARPNTSAATSGGNRSVTFEDGAREGLFAGRFPFAVDPRVAFALDPRFPFAWGVCALSPLCA